MLCLCARHIISPLTKMEMQGCLIIMIGGTDHFSAFMCEMVIGRHCGGETEVEVLTQVWSHLHPVVSCPDYRVIILK